MVAHEFVAVRALLFVGLLLQFLFQRARIISTVYYIPNFLFGRQLILSFYFELQDFAVIVTLCYQFEIYICDLIDIYFINIFLVKLPDYGKGVIIIVVWKLAWLQNIVIELNAFIEGPTVVIHYWTLLHLRTSKLVVWEFARPHYMDWLLWQIEQSGNAWIFLFLIVVFDLLDWRVLIVYILAFVDLAEFLDVFWVFDIILILAISRITLINRVSIYRTV